MSKDPNHPSNQPGGGFTPVGGHGPPAGSQAEQIARDQERARQQQQHDHNKAWEATTSSKASSSGNATPQKKGGCLIVIVTGLGLSGLLATGVAVSNFI